MLPKSAPSQCLYLYHYHALSRRKSVQFLIGFVLLVLLVATMIKYDVSIITRSFSLFPSSSSIKNNIREVTCKSLMLHEEGRWEHLYAPRLQGISASLYDVQDTNTINKTYFPIEIDWILRGTNSSEAWVGCHANDDGLTYVSKLGHQCGCGLSYFRPSLSRWISAGGTPSAANVLVHHHHNDEFHSPTLRLILRLAKANMSLCLAGDSIDLQFYDAMRNNLSRQRKLLENQINISISERYSIPANYTNDTGVPMYTGWMTMSHIAEMIVSLKYQTSNDGESYTTRVRYFQMYGWSPWVTPFMDDCNVVVMNLGLHYSAQGEMRGTHFGGPKYEDDVMAAITYLADFASATSGRDRIAVWRSVLPQHFHTTNGSWGGDGECSLERWRPSGIGQEIQIYNNVTNSIFLENCLLIAQEVSTPSCRRQHHEYDCTVNRTSVEYSTVYKYLLQNNCTARLARFQERQGSIVTGRILRWNIADLFDVPEWHVSGGDCSHFCYVMPLYEAAFERLGLLLPPFDN